MAVNQQQIGWDAIEQLLNSDKVSADVKGALRGVVQRNKFGVEVKPATGKFPSLVHVSGPGFKPKNLSPRLLLQILEHSDEVRLAARQCIDD